MRGCPTRSGTTPGADEKVSFYRSARSKLPEGVTLKYCRADNLFSGKVFLHELESDGVQYAIKLRVTAGLRKRIRLGVLWERIQFDDEQIVEIGAVGFRAQGWSKYRRVVVIHSKPTRIRQPKLFADYEWEYQAIVTNLNWAPIDVWRFYNQRCTCENHTKELKYGLGIDSISKNGFWPNFADLWLKVIAYNVLLPGRGVRRSSIVLSPLRVLGAPCCKYRPF